LEYQKIIIVSWITIGDPSVAEIMAKAGFDWLATNKQRG
jgi:2-dehydro-3-deoxyglucarate aldolase